MSRHLLVVLGLLLTTLTYAGDDDVPKYELSLYTGITGIVKLGDTPVQMAQHLGQMKPEPEEISDEVKKLKFTEIQTVSEMGMKVYFRRSGAVLITLQEPFKGTIRSKKIRLFSFSLPPVDDWEVLLIRELGQPDLRASGGRFGSQGLFYNWGDISFNKMGPNQLALYRDAEIAKWRQTNFGREVQLFNLKK